MSWEKWNYEIDVRDNTENVSIKIYQRSQLQYISITHKCIWYCDELISCKDQQFVVTTYHSARQCVEDYVSQCILYEYRCPSVSFLVHPFMRDARPYSINANWKGERRSVGNIIWNRWKLTDNEVGKQNLTSQRATNTCMRWNLTGKWLGSLYHLPVRNSNIIYIEV